jgi:hypothetical protein
MYRTILGRSFFYGNVTEDEFSHSTSTKISDECTLPDGSTLNPIWTIYLAQSGKKDSLMIG